MSPDKPVVFLGAAQEAVLVAPYKLSSVYFAEFLKTRSACRPASCVSGVNMLELSARIGRIQLRLEGLSGES